MAPRCRSLPPAGALSGFGRPCATEMALQPPHSLRARLLWFLLAAISLTALIQGFSAYRTARAEADAIFDYHMQRIALSLRAGLPANSLGSAGDDSDDENFDF